MKKILTIISVFSVMFILANILGSHIPFLANAGEILPIFRGEENVMKTELYEEKKVTLRIQKNCSNLDKKENLVEEEIEEGFELVTDSFISSHQAVKHTVNGNIIIWDVREVPCEIVEVSYHIKRIGGTLVVEYVDEEGAQIISPEFSIHAIGEEYELQKKEIPGYRYVRVEGEEKGSYKGGITSITYYYEKVSNELPQIPPPIDTNNIETHKGKLIVKYIDEATGNDIVEAEETTGDIGTTYSIIDKIIPEYEYIKVDGKEEGIYEKGTITVTYYYKKYTPPPIPSEESPVESKTEVKKSKVVVKYLDEETGKEIASTYESTGNVGEEYTIIKKEIPGYEYLNNDEQESGNYTEETTTVSYYYHKIQKSQVVETSKVTPKLAAKVISKKIKLSIKDVNQKPYSKEKVIRDINLMLPKTGESVPIFNYVIGSIFIIIGVFLSIKLTLNKRKAYSKYYNK